MNISGNNFICEVKLPLNKDDSHPFAIGTEVGKSIGIGFEIPEIGIGELRGKMGGGIDRGHMRGGGMRRGGRPGGFGGNGRGRPQIPEPLEFWAKLNLRVSKHWMIPL